MGAIDRIRAAESKKEIDNIISEALSYESTTATKRRMMRVAKARQRELEEQVVE